MNGGGEGVVKTRFRRRHLFPHELVAVAPVLGPSGLKQSWCGRGNQKQEEEEEEEDEEG